MEQVGRGERGRTQRAEGRGQNAEGRTQRAERRRQNAEGSNKLLTSHLSPLTLFSHTLQIPHNIGELLFGQI